MSASDCMMTKVYTACVLSSMHNYCMLYNQKIWRFGGLACNLQIKIHQYLLLAYIRMAIPYRTAKLKNQPIFLQWSQLPNLIPANICGYTVLRSVYG